MPGYGVEGNLQSAVWESQVEEQKLEIAHLREDLARANARIETLEEDLRKANLEIDELEDEIAMSEAGENW